MAELVWAGVVGPESRRRQVFRRRQFLGNNHDQFSAARLDGCDGPFERVVRALLAVITDNDGLAHQQIMAGPAGTRIEGRPRGGGSFACPGSAESFVDQIGPCQSRVPCCRCVEVGGRERCDSASLDELDDRDVDALRCSVGLLVRERVPDGVVAQVVEFELAPEVVFNELPKAFSGFGLAGGGSRMSVHRELSDSSAGVADVHR